VPTTDTPTPAVRTVQAHEADELTARIVRSSPLTYDRMDGMDGEASEAPGHVRAASALVRLIDRFALVQDDANFLGLVDADTHEVRGVPLPPAPDGARVHNVEGAVFMGPERLRLFQRGNADPRGDLQPVDATGDLSWPALKAYLADPIGTAPPAIENVIQYELGDLHGVRLTFSDAEALEEGITLFSASAENEETGKIVGSVLGIIDADGEARWAELLDEGGEPFGGKVEGLSRKPGETDHVYFVIDSDDADRASRVYEADLDGPWYAQF
jgi:hypothetical protein